MASAFRVGAEEYRKAQAQVGDQLAVQAGEFFQADFGKLATLGGFLLLDFAQHAFDQVAGQFQVDRQLDDFSPAPAVLLAEVFAGHLRQVEFDRAVQRFDVVAEAAHFLGDGRLFAAQYFLHGGEHVVYQVAQAQCFPSSVGQCQARRGERGQVKMTGFGLAIGFFALGQQPGTQPCHRPDGGQQNEATRDVVEQVEGDDHALGAVVQAVHPQHQRVEYRNDQQQADQFVQQATQRDLATGGVLHAGAEEGQHTAADIGADHQADGYVQADHTGAGQGGGQ